MFWVTGAPCWLECQPGSLVIQSMTAVLGPNTYLDVNVLSWIYLRLFVDRTFSTHGAQLSCLSPLTAVQNALWNAAPREQKLEGGCIWGCSGRKEEKKSNSAGRNWSTHRNTLVEPGSCLNQPLNLSWVFDCNGVYGKGLLSTHQSRITDWLRDLGLGIMI